MGARGSRISGVLGLGGLLDVLVGNGKNPAEQQSKHDMATGRIYGDGRGLLSRVDTLGGFPILRVPV